MFKGTISWHRVLGPKGEVGIDGFGMSKPEHHEEGYSICPALFSVIVLEQ